MAPVTSIASERLAELADLADLFDDEAARATFGRGLVIGALVGAAIAGTLLRRRRRRIRAREVARIEPPGKQARLTSPPPTTGP